MKERVVFYVIVLLLIVPSSYVYSDIEGGAMREIPKVYESYIGSVLATDGEAAAHLVSQGSLDYYGKMRDLALYGDKKQLTDLPWFDKAIVLRLRHELSSSILKNMTNKELFALGVSEGWTDPRGVQGTEVRDIEASNRIGFGVMYRNGDNTSLKLRFKKEMEQWKFDALYLLRAVGLATESQIKKLAEQNNITLDELIILLTEGASSKPVTSDLWVPMLK